jgi:hypothetical protein
MVHFLYSVSFETRIVYSTQAIDKTSGKAKAEGESDEGE